MQFDELDMDAFAQLPDPIESENTPVNEEEEEVEITEEPVKEKPDKPVAEEEDPEKVGTEEEEDETSDEDGKSQPSLYSSLAKVLAEEGVLPSLSDEDPIQSVDDLVNAVRKEIKQNEFADLTEEQKSFLQAIRSGVPFEEVKQQQSAYQNLQTITREEIEGNDALRKSLLVADFKTKGYSDEKAQKLAQRSIDIGEDVEDAVEALEGLKLEQKKLIDQQIKQAEADKQAKQQKYNEDLKKFKQTLDSTTEIIPGVKITPQVAQKVFEQATKPVPLKDGRYVNEMAKARLENPIEFEAKLNYLFYITKGFSDFSKIAKSQKTKAVKELDDFVKGNSFTPKASDMGDNYDFTPKELEKGFDEALIQNIR